MISLSDLRHSVENLANFNLIESHFRNWFHSGDISILKYDALAPSIRNVFPRERIKTSKCDSIVFIFIYFQTNVCENKSNYDVIDGGDTD